MRVAVTRLTLVFIFTTHVHLDLGLGQRASSTVHKHQVVICNLAQMMRKWVVKLERKIPDMFIAVTQQGDDTDSAALCPCREKLDLLK